MFKKIISVIGLGYIGLPTAAVIAKKGFTVNGIDTNKNLVSQLNKKKVLINELGLNSIIKSSILSGKLRFFTRLKPSDIYIICVPTPIIKTKNKPKPDIRYILKATKSIAKIIKSEDMIILESTAPIGTTKKIKEILYKYNYKLKNIYIAYCPERVLPGNILSELVNNDRIIGGLDLSSTEKIASFYKSFIKGKIHKTDAVSAEMCKLVENSFRDVNIAFANELSIICDKIGVNTRNLIKLANNHPRVNILNPGTGVGGHCIAIDPWFLVNLNKKNTKLIQVSRKINDYKCKWITNKILNTAYKFKLKFGVNPKIACLGLSYKENVQDLRESKAIVITENLLAKGFKVYPVEPNIKFHEKFILSSIFKAIKNADIICVLVKHREFLDTKIKKKLIKKKALDFCGALN